MTSTNTDFPEQEQPTAEELSMTKSKAIAIMQSNQSSLRDCGSVVEPIFQMMTPPSKSVLTRPSTMKQNEPLEDRGSVVEPIFQTSTFRFQTAEAGERAFAIAYGLADPLQGEEVANIYTRVSC